MNKVLIVCIALIALCSVAAASPNGAVECHSICPLIYMPQCATDDSGNSQTFPNDCSREQENCQRKTNFQKIADGPCP